MDGVLPDAEEVINKITVLLSLNINMFFAIAISEKPREYATFSWEVTQYSSRDYHKVI